MFIFKNAFSNIWCSKGRNILIGIIVLVIAVSSCIALSVKEAAKRAETSSLDNMSITASIAFDREKLMESAETDGTDFRELMQNTQDLTLDEMLVYSESSYVSDFRYMISTSINGNDDLEAVTEETATTEEDTDQSVLIMDGGRQEENFNFSQGDFTIIGYSSYNAMTDFVSGSSIVTDGEVFDLASSDYQCVISAELAAYNGLAVGDTITLANPNDEEQTFEFTITGLYSYTSDESSGDFNMRFSTAMDPANQIYTSYAALNTMVEYTSENEEVYTSDNGMEQTTALSETTSGVYVFSDVEDYNSFTSDVATLGLSDEYTVSSTDLTTYESSLIPIQNTENFADMMMRIIIGVGGAILVVLNIFNIRERKYEVGVLTAIGMKKSKVAMQFVTELLVVTLLAVMIGTAIGAAVSVPVSNSLLESQVTAIEAQYEEQSSNFGRGGETMPGMGGGPTASTTQQASYITTLNATTDLTVVGQLMGLGVALTMIASLGAIVFVMRYEPLKILSERT